MGAKSSSETEMLDSEDVLDPVFTLQRQMSSIGNTDKNSQSYQEWLNVLQRAREEDTRTLQ